MIRNRKHAGCNVGVELLVKGNQKEKFRLSDTVGKHTTFDFAKGVEKSTFSLEKVAKLTKVDLDHILKTLRENSLFGVHDLEDFAKHSL